MNRRDPTDPTVPPVDWVLNSMPEPVIHAAACRDTPHDGRVGVLPADTDELYNYFERTEITNGLLHNLQQAYQQVSNVEIDGCPCTQCDPDQRFRRQPRAL